MESEAREQIIKQMGNGAYEQAWQLFQQCMETKTTSLTEEEYVLKASILQGLGHTTSMLATVEEGLRENFGNYELYVVLGDYYMSINPNQAYLCYENASLYAKDQDKECIHFMMKQVREQYEILVKPVSIVILSYNEKAAMEECIKSIQLCNLEETYELVVVDNASSDGVVEWLRQQDDIILIENQVNEGFPKGCNQGIQAASKENDVLLLNNDTVVLPNSIFWLRMGLYEEETVGATGSVSNYVDNDQRIYQQFDSKEQYIEFGMENNGYWQFPYVKKSYLVGFAMLIKRQVIEKVGVLDERFGLGHFEDTDYGMQLLDAGYKLLLCKNSFIYHKGSLSFGKDKVLFHRINQENLEQFKQKWGFDITYYNHARKDLVDKIIHKSEDFFSLIEIGCGLGSTLGLIHHCFPKAALCGMEIEKNVAHMGSHLFPIVSGNAEKVDFPCEKESQDYVIFGDVLEHLYDPGAMIEKAASYLKPGGAIIASILNLMHASALIPLLKGHFTYKDAGILDRTHIRFFTLNEIVDLFQKKGFQIENICYSSGENAIFHEEQEMIEALKKIPGFADPMMLEAYQYIFRAVKM